MKDKEMIEEMASENFRFGQTFAEVNAQIKAINNQITIFDLIGE